MIGYGEVLLYGRVVGTITDVEFAYPERIGLSYGLSSSWSVNGRIMPRAPRPSKGWRRHIRRVKRSNT